MEDDTPTDRERFGSRIAFYFAAVGSAVGFGNIWRFPALAYEYGGGAFFIPYILALFLVGIPILFLEISLGQYYQKGDVGVFYSIHRRLGGIGVTSVACGYMMLIYYSMLITWVTHGFFDSWSDDAPWSNDVANVTEATSYFNNKIVGMETLNEMNGTRLVPENVGYSVLVWFLIWICLAFGLEVTGKITYFTMGFPILLLFIFLIKASTLEGSSDGISQYIGQWDTDVLTDRPDCWSLAVTQIFFSLSVTFGVMSAYGSHLPRSEPAFLNSCVVAIVNCMFSFIAGFAVFATVGHLANLEGKEVTELDNIGGFGLVFGTWPVVFSTLKNGEHWVRLLFLNLFLLGIDSAFSLMEGVITCLKDTSLLKKYPKWTLSAIACTVGWLLSLMYASDAGLFFLDVMDYYINFVMIIIGFFESFAVGWVYGIEDQFEQFGVPAVIMHMIANFGAVVIGSGIWFGLDDDDHNVWAGFVGFVVFYLVGMLFTKYLLQGKSLSGLAFGNMLQFKAKFEPVVGNVPYMWCFIIKQAVPHILLILLVNMATTKTTSGESKLGHYSNYDTRPYQVLGILIFTFACFLFVMGLLFPFLYYCFVPEDHGHELVDKEEDSARDKKGDP